MSFSRHPTPALGKCKCVARCSLTSGVATSFYIPAKVRTRIFGAELRIEKPSDARTPPRRAIGVLIVDYGNKRNLDILVDASGKVVRAIDLQGVQPAYLDEEIIDARRIAEQDKRVARYAKMKRSFVSAFGPERTSDNARRIGLRYAVVDLSTDTVARLDETPTESGSER